MKINHPQKFILNAPFVLLYYTPSRTIKVVFATNTKTVLQDLKIIVKRTSNDFRSLTPRVEIVKI